MAINSRVQSTTSDSLTVFTIQQSRTKNYRIDHQAARVKVGSPMYHSINNPPPKGSDSTSTDVIFTGI